MDLSVLAELGEWAAYGFYENEALPLVRRYGRAYRCLYEHMPVAVKESHLLTPCEVMYSGLNANNGMHHCVGAMVNLFHSSGLMFEPDMAVIKKEIFPQYAALIDEMGAQFAKDFAGRTQYIHSNPDILTVVTKGFSYIERQLEMELACTSDEREQDFLFALRDYSAGIRAYYLCTLEALSDAAEAASGIRKEKLSLLKAEFANTFYNPAQTFIGGLLAVNFVFMLDGCDSIGRLDYVLGSLFEQDIAAGKLALDFARELLDDLFHIFEEMNAWNLQLGGRSADGKDSCNLLTQELLLCTKRNRQIRPNVALKLSGDTPDAIWNSAIDCIWEGTGRPALYNEDLYLDILHSALPGIPMQDLIMYGFGGCTETMLTGMSCVDSLAGAINTAKILEETLPCLPQCETFDRFFTLLKQNIKKHTDQIVADINCGLEYRREHGDPKLARSLFTRGCIASHRSFEACGADYNWSIITYDGTSVVIDSLYAVKHLVYDTRQLSASELLAALNANFEGYANVLNLLEQCSKFGNDCDSVDYLGTEFLEFTWSLLSAYPHARNGFFMPSVILFETYDAKGAEVGALPNGRRAYTPLNDSVGAVAGCDKNGPTALLNSVLKLPLHLAAGTPVLNLRFMKNLIQTEEGRKKIISLIKCYFDRGGPQIQISVLDSAEMKAAQLHPEQYEDLIVRIGGYSAYFVRLTKELQESVIARTENA